MTKFIAILNLFFIISLPLIGQQTFSKHHDVGVGDVGASIAKRGNGYVLTGSYLCNNTESSCYFIINTDSVGTLNTVIEYHNNPWCFCTSNINGNTGYVQESDSTFYFTGAIQVNGGPFGIFLMKTDGLGDSLWMKTYGVAGLNVYNNHLISRSDTSLLIYNEGKVAAAEYRLWLLEVDLQGNVLWEGYYGQEWDRVMPQDIIRLDNGDVVFSYLSCDETPCESFTMSVTRISPQGVTRWTSTFADFDGTLGTAPFSSLLPLDDGGFLVNYRRYHPDGPYIKDPAILVWLDADGNITRQYDFDDAVSTHITDMIKTSDGTIVGVGSAVLLHFNDLGPLGGYIFAMSQEGELLWERYFQDLALPDRAGWFSGLVETDSGGFAMTGTVFTPAGADTWLVQLDSMGCFEPGCTTKVQVAHGVYNTLNETESKPKRVFSVYPNPVQGTELNIAASFSPKEATEIMVFNMLGQIVKKQAFASTLDVSTLSPGPYMLGIRVGNGWLGFEQFFVSRP